MMLYYRITPPAAVLLLPALLLVAFCAALGVGLFLAALNVKYRDVRFVIPFIVQIWMYCTVIVPFSEFRQRFGDRLGALCYLYGLNPMAGVVEGFRWCLLHDRMTTTSAVERVLEGRVVPEALEEGQEVILKVLDSGATQVVLREIERAPVDPPWTLIAIGVPVALALLAIGVVKFKRMEDLFADVV